MRKGSKQRKANFAFETEWLREYARTYEPSDAGFTFRPQQLREQRISLVQIRDAMRSGTVLDAEKLDEPGAIWTVFGEDCDGVGFDLIVHVVSEIFSVELIRVSVFQTREIGNDAA